MSREDFLTQRLTERSNELHDLKIENEQLRTEIERLRAAAGGEQDGEAMGRASALLATVWDMKQLSNPPTVGIGIDWLIARLTEVVGGERGGEAVSVPQETADTPIT